MLYNVDENSNKINICLSYQGNILKNTVLLNSKKESNSNEYVFIHDSGSNLNLVNDINILKDVKKVNYFYEISGIGPNVIKTNVIGYLPFNMGPAYLVDYLPYNIISNSVLSKNYLITFDNNKNSFYCENKSNTIKVSFDFVLNKLNNLYQFVVDRNNFFNNLNYICYHTTPCKNILNTNNFLLDFNSYQNIPKKLKFVRDLHQVMNHPSDQVLMETVKSGVLGNVQISWEDVIKLNKTFGTCIECKESKATRIGTKFSEHEVVAPGEVVEMDIFFIGSSLFLLLIDLFSGFIMTYNIKSKSKSHVMEGIENIKAKFNSYKIDITILACDKESSFTYLEKEINLLGIQLVQFSPQDHASVCERAIRSIKQKIMSTIYDFQNTYFTFPLFLVKYLVAWCTTSNNILVNSKCKPKCPRQIFDPGFILHSDFLNIKFGDVYYFRRPNSKNGLSSKIELCLVVGRDVKSPGVVQAVSLESGEIVTRRQIVVFDIKKNLDKFQIIRNLLKQYESLDVQEHVNNLFKKQHQSDVVNIENEILYKNKHVDSTTHQLKENLQLVDSNINKINSSSKNDGVDEIENNDLNKNFHKIQDILAYKWYAGKKQYLVHWIGFPEEEATWVSRHDLRGYSSKELSKIKTYYKYLKDKSLNINLITNINSSIALSQCYLSVKQSMVKNYEGTISALKNELNSFIQLDVFDAILPDDVNKNVLEKTVIGFGHLKEKLDTQGNLIKIKGRIIANGATQPSSTFDSENLYSPTVRSDSLKILLNVACFRDYNIKIMDVGCAFLNTPLSTEIYVKFTPEIVKILIDIDEKYKKFVNDKGCIYVKLKKSLYGLTQSPRLWFDHFSKCLQDFGYKALINDGCIFKKNDNLISLHVDDIFAIGPNISELNDLENYLKSKFNNISVNSDAESLEYLGLHLVRDRKNKTISIDQFGYLKSLLVKYDVKSTAVTPITPALFRQFVVESTKNSNSKINFKNDSSTPVSMNVLENDIDGLDDEDNNNFYVGTTNEFISRIMSIAFLIGSRPDIGYCLSLLQTKCSNPSLIDWKITDRLLRYLNNTQKECLVIKPHALDQIFAYTDASFNTDHNNRSHSGGIISIGELDGVYSGLVYLKSCTQSIISVSSTESEIEAAFELSKQIIWTKNFMNEINFIQKPSILHIDNQSSIKLLKNPSSSFKRTKHLLLRYNYLRELIEKNEIQIVYKPTEELISDYLTKPLQGIAFKKLKDVIMHDMVLKF